MSDSVWLIEDQDHFPRHRWMRIVDAGKTAYLQWEHDANIATHFARREDAIAFQKLHLDFCALSIVTSHCFIAAAQQAPSGQQAEPTEAMVDAYLKAQAEAVQAVDDLWGRGGKAPSHIHPVREACRAGLKAALAANQKGD